MGICYKKKVFCLRNNVRLCLGISGILPVNLRAGNSVLKESST